MIADYQAMALQQPSIDPMDQLSHWVEQNARAANKWVEDRFEGFESLRGKFLAFMPVTKGAVAVPLAPTKPKEKTDFIPKEIPKIKNLRFRVEDGKA